MAATTKNEENAGNADTIVTKTQELKLPAPYATKSANNYCEVIGWAQNKTPVVPPGFTVTAYVTGLVNPRNVYEVPNGDVFAVESNTVSKGIKDKLSGKAASQRLGSSANRITLLRDVNKDGVPDVRIVYLAGLNQSYGVLVMKNSFHVANTDGV